MRRRTGGRAAAVFTLSKELAYEVEVLSELKLLNEKKAVGIDNIPVSILNGIFPSRLKITKVTPLYKNGPSHQTTNCRPISILTPISKVFEKLIHVRLNK